MILSTFLTITAILGLIIFSHWLLESELNKRIQTINHNNKIFKKAIEELEDRLNLIE